MILTLETNEGGSRQLSVPDSADQTGLIAFDSDCTLLYQAETLDELIQKIRQDGWDRVHVEQDTTG